MRKFLKSLRIKKKGQHKLPDANEHPKPERINWRRATSVSLADIQLRRPRIRHFKVKTGFGRLDFDNKNEKKRGYLQNQ